ncbi:hypothetical protein J6590_033248 [Homalodisca vitripennis]|nr:hypothetical protein J6590_033248 [Homalodisca vitripennis]
MRCASREPSAYRRDASLLERDDLQSPKDSRGSSRLHPYTEPASTLLQQDCMESLTCRSRSWLPRNFARS